MDTSLIPATLIIAAAVALFTILSLFSVLTPNQAEEVEALVTL
jgi:hypothetical protein